MPKELSEIAKSIHVCKLCPLYVNRTRTVPGEGNLHVRVMFIGEAPGQQEDETGRPFCGRSGKLLTELLREAGLSRKDVFITSVVKCRPPSNRKPKPDEIKVCVDNYLRKQISVLKPRIICLLGNTAVEALLGKLRMKDVHGTAITGDLKVYFPTYHPAAGIRNARLIPTMKEDMKKLKRLSLSLNLNLSLLAQKDL